MENQDTFNSVVQSGNIEQAETMINQHPDWVDARNDQGLPVVLLAAYHHQPAMAELLFQRGARLDVFSAAALGKLDFLRQELERNPDLVNGYAPDGFQPLGLAAFFNQKEAALCLLENGAEVNTHSRNMQKVTPLHSAAAAGALEIARMLLIKKGDANAVQEGGSTPLHAAAQNGQVAMIDLLLCYNAKINTRNKEGKTPLTFAREKDRTGAISLLEEHGAKD